MTEARAILEARKYCKNSQFNQAIIQINSMLMSEVLKGNWATPWAITDKSPYLRISPTKRKWEDVYKNHRGNKRCEMLISLGYLNQQKGLGKREIFGFMHLNLEDTFIISLEWRIGATFAPNRAPLVENMKKMNTKNMKRKKDGFEEQKAIVPENKPRKKRVRTTYNRKMKC
ncbi:hypothetical protein H5410_005819 [Solanum commersonii]|uniref:Uncharacterized protein n=1 Tax=Solanum commersonii TaxID=4109 RepID=A0A9J6A7W6_SOLCO|nr:hypothetical protein H5410_005819 [Solanum commersonii]